MNHSTLTLCLLGTAILCRATTTPEPSTEQTEPTYDPTSDLTSAVTSSPAPTLEDTTYSSSNTPSNTPSELPTAQADTTTMDPTSTHSTSTESTSVPTSQPQVEGSEGLSPGEIAAITIGTIAGVAAVGGGIFAALKFTGKI